MAGRTCYKSEGKDPEKFVAMIIGRGHESVLEHASFTFKLTIDRGVSHELVRHRTGIAYSQESTRYCNYSKEKFGSLLTFIHQHQLDNITILEQRIKLFGQIEKQYLAEIAAGVPAQIARDILPNCLKTEVVVTANMREWRHIFKLRLSKAAHPQMRRIMSQVFNWFAFNYPVLVEGINNDI